MSDPQKGSLASIEYQDTVGGDTARRVPTVSVRCHCEERSDEESQYIRLLQSKIPAFPTRGFAHGSGSQTRIKC